MANVMTPREALMLVVEEQMAKTRLMENVTAMRMAKRTAYQDQLKWNVNVQGAVSSGRATTANASAASADTIKPARLDIGKSAFSHTTTILRSDITQARATAPGALSDLFESHVQSGLEVILKDLNQAVYTGDGLVDSAGVIGLVQASDPTAEYATIPATDWAPAVLANAGTNRALTEDLLFSMEVAIARKGGSYSAIYTTPEIVKKYKMLFGDERTLTVNQLNGVADLGFSGTSFSGRPVIQDVDCPDNTLYFVNEADLALYTYKIETSKKIGGLEISVAELPLQNTLAVSYEMAIQPQVRVFNRQKSIAVLKDITQ